jgi:hypothetical protein
LILINVVVNIIGDYVKKDNHHNRMHKICKKYAKLYKELDRKKESKRTFNLNDEEREEYIIRDQKTDKHFDKLEDLVHNKYYNNIRSITLDYCRTKPYIIFEILIDGEYKRFRYF